jgi:hypothetical protein
LDKFARALKRFQVPVPLDVAQRPQGALRVRRIVIPAQKPQAAFTIGFNQLVNLPLHILSHRVHVNTMLPRGPESPPFL